MSERQRWWKCGAVVLTGLVMCVFAPDSYGLVNYSNHPDLAKAMEFDPACNGGDMIKADRAQAEHYYLKYLEDVKDSFQQARVHAQLGALYAVSFNRKKGEGTQLPKGPRRDYEKVLGAEPKRMGPPPEWARSMLCSLETQPGMERIKARMEFYAWLDSWDEAKIKELWLPERKPSSNDSAALSGIADANEAFAAKVRAMMGAQETGPAEGEIRRNPQRLGGLQRGYDPERGYGCGPAFDAGGGFQVHSRTPPGGCS